MRGKFTIVGGGIAGLTTAIALNKAGIDAHVFEAAPEIKAVGAGIALAANAVMAYKNLGIADEVIQRGRILPSFSLYDQKGRLITKTDTNRLGAKYGVDNFTIHRHDLHKLLLSKIDPQYIQTNKKAIAIEQNEKSVLVKFQDGSVFETDFLIVADGINSSIRQQLVPRSEPRYSGYTCWRAVIENSNLNLTESSETWGTNGRFGIVPLANNRVYWFACVNSTPNNPIFKNYTAKDILNHFKDFHHPIPIILKETKDEDLIWNDIIDLKPINQYAFNNIVLIGDAAHATTPNMGQGACQAIEDAVILGNELKENPDVKNAFIKFEKKRIKRTHYITNTSWTVGKVAQIENKFLAGIRNQAFRLMPSWVNDKQLKKLYDIEF